MLKLIQGFGTGVGRSSLFSRGVAYFVTGIRLVLLTVAHERGWNTMGGGGVTSSTQKVTGISEGENHNFFGWGRRRK